jgi:hypothetical protein
MGIVDQAKALRATATERLLPQKFVFHHIPKCGGTSVGRALRKRYLLSQATVTPESSFRAFEAFTGRTDREQMLVDVLDLREQMLLYHMYEGVRGLSLHVRFSERAHARFSDGYKFVTILREPLERFVSHYHWSHNKPHAHAHIDEDFLTFLDTDRAKRIGSTFVEYLSGLPKEIPPYSGEAIAAAVANLAHFQVVGRLDRLDLFEQDLKRELGVRVRIGHENKGKLQTVRKPELDDPVLRSRIEDLCAPDLAVWNAAFGGHATA